MPNTEKVSHLTRRSSHLHFPYTPAVYARILLVPYTRETDLHLQVGSGHARTEDTLAGMGSFETQGTERSGTEDTL